ncbi:MAG: methionyl-tRNA formyltransferase [Candidatus Nealsonbacteria bacterium CG10_big_fil_rev_8_21_14_0_10_36_24]|uniref:Methionyl-tRNA formyltransferase n=2 Tax=Candidatus Nealsoniibacteriota TaxID=1817911 RepID=A0A2H0YPY2_9BACT|nr:MAG: methionyl-tRNA formyltransferase [Candidatus Nealsonbacteria bacterium CG10_big_fil_rev_8_21_14_0_10_36_24]PIS40329.1 MAG: methionyl-tRNA formyltransferase [Candidatus Nealsonbacteria bacterium CG08_land_8_20_14_0_20_36_22]
MQNDKEKFKIIFLGTPEFGVIILEGLINGGHKPILVVTAPDKPVGRKQMLTPPPVKTIAQKYNILIEQPKKIKNLELKIKNLKPDLGIVAAYGHIIPQEILTIPKYGFLNVHPSLLPKYRGPSPIQTAILNGDEETGVTIILMDEKIDHGPILAKRELEFSISNFQFSKLHDKLAELGVKLLLETIAKWINGEIKPKPQNESKATYTKIIKKDDGKINWSRPTTEIEKQIRAFNPWPGTFTFIKKNNLPSLKLRRASKIIRVKILEAEVSKSNQLIIKKIQPEGKKPMTFEEFKRGYL